MRRNLFTSLPVCLGLAIALTGCATSKAQKTNALQDAFKDDFLIGVAVNQRQFTEDDARGAALIKTHSTASHRKMFSSGKVFIRTRMNSTFSRVTATSSLARRTA
jgi:hypothetical protein